MKSALCAHNPKGGPLRLWPQGGQSLASMRFQRQPYGLRGFHRVVGAETNLHSNQMQVTPPVLIVAAMVTLLFMVPAVALAAFVAIWAGVSAEARVAFVAVATAWAVVMGRFVGP